MVELESSRRRASRATILGDGASEVEITVYRTSQEALMLTVLCIVNAVANRILREEQGNSSIDIPEVSNCQMWTSAFLR